jgi:hypothetical protein
MSFLRTLALIVMASLLVSLLTAGGVHAETMSTSDTRTIGYDQHTVIMLYETTESSFVTFTFNVNNYANVDVLIMTNEDYQAYIIDAPFEYLPGSVLNSAGSSASQSTPGQGTVIYVVIDNTEAPAGGAVPIGSITVEFSVTATNAEFPSFIKDIILIVAIGGVAFVVVLLVILYFIFFRKKAPTAPMNQSGTKICPNCGTSVPYEFQFCPKCGRRW